MESPWKAISDSSRRKILLLLKERDMTPTEISKHFQFSLPAVSIHLRILKNSGLILEQKVGKNRIYSLNKEKDHEMNGKNIKFIPNRKLSYTWRFQSKPEFNKDTIVTWRFESLSKEKTKVILRHSGFTEDDRQQYNEHSEGWTWFINRLRNYLTKGEP